MKWILYFLAAGWAHENHNHNHSYKQDKVEKAPDLYLAVINASYVQSVKPIFEKKCLDCHGGKTKFPWYYKIPGARQLIDHDINESKEHLDFTTGFPFKGHHTPKEQIQSIAEVMRDGSMPPWRYWLAHWDSKITAEEREVILRWTKDSLFLFP
jgi:hypothetical protein